MVAEPASIDRFRSDLDALIDPAARIGIAVSGGADSLALLLLAAASRSGPQPEAADVTASLATQRAGTPRAGAPGSAKPRSRAPGSPKTR